MSLTKDLTPADLGKHYLTSQGDRAELLEITYNINGNNTAAFYVESRAAQWSEVVMTAINGAKITPGGVSVDFEYVKYPEILD
jgi:hypothetical protein